jgi:hypothetical protein
MTKPERRTRPGRSPATLIPFLIREFDMGRVILLAFAGVVVGGLVGAFPGWSFFNNITFKIPIYTGGSSFSSQDYDLSKIIAALGFVFGAASGSIVGALAATAQTIREAAEQASKVPVRR